MATAKQKHTMVFAVNIVSPSKNHVKAGNTTIPVEKPTNLADQADPVASTIVLQAYQNATEVGIPIIIEVKSGLFCHHEDRYWAFNWNHPMVWPVKNNAIPKIRDVFIDPICRLIRIVFS